jgi:4-hydroxy-2-oxoheptanedioate aldolase
MIGIFSKTIDSGIIEAAGYAGLDFIILDQEHGPSSLHTLHNHVRAAKLTGMKSFVRVPSNLPHYIGAALDTGADGVQIPNVSSYEEAMRAVKATRFHPKGMRGVCRFVRAANYGIQDKESYFSYENTKKIILQVEGKEGVAALERMLSIDDFDVLFVGPYDLSQSVGYPGQINHPEVEKLIVQVADMVKASGKRLGTFADNLNTAIHLKNTGFDFIAYSVDIALFAEKIQSIKQDLS